MYERYHVLIDPMYTSFEGTFDEKKTQPSPSQSPKHAGLRVYKNLNY